MLSPTSTRLLSHAPKAGSGGFKISPEKTLARAGLTTNPSLFVFLASYTHDLASPIFSLGFRKGENVAKIASPRRCKLYPDLKSLQ